MTKPATRYSLRDSETKNWIALALSSGAVAGLVVYAAEWGGMNKAVTDHIANPAIHGNADAVEGKIGNLEAKVEEHKRNFEQFRAEQGAVNQRVLQSLGVIEREILIEQNTRR